MKGLYQDILLDHYKNPRNSGVLPHATIASGQYNPSCGDRVEVTGTVFDGVLTDVRFEARGCVISVATASLLSEAIKNKCLDEITNIDAQVIRAMIGISLGPTRLKCALLPLNALHDGLRTYQKAQEAPCSITQNLRTPYIK